MAQTVGFIGLGVMGRPMALNLLKKGFSLVVHNRSRSVVQELVEAGAESAENPVDVARRATRIVTMLPDGPDVTAVLDGPNGVFSAIQPRTILIDTSSIAPAVARQLAKRATERGATMLDAPVSGGEVGAINATLSIMVGGDARAFADVKPILDAMGNPERVIRIGDSGAGQVCKVCNQMVIGGTLAAVSEAFALARRAGVDAARVREALLGGFAASRVLEVHGERMLTGNYKPGFRTRLYAKDLRIATQTLSEHQVAAPVAAVVQQLVNALMAAGRADDDYAALATVLFELAGVEEVYSRLLEEPAMTRAEIEQFFKRRERAWHDRDPDALAADHAEDGVVESPTHGTLESRLAIRNVYATWFDAFPDLTFVQDDLIVEGDRVALFFTSKGTHIKPFASIPATGRHMSIRGVFVIAFRDGKIAHEKRYYDSTSLLLQIGVLKAKPL